MTMPLFKVGVDETAFTLAQMLVANRDDEDFCAWARCAKVGDYYDGGESCTAIAPSEEPPHTRPVFRVQHRRCNGTGWIDNPRTETCEPCVCAGGFIEVYREEKKA